MPAVDSQVPSAGVTGKPAGKLSAQMPEVELVDGSCIQLGFGTAVGEGWRMSRSAGPGLVAVVVVAAVVVLKVAFGGNLLVEKLPQPWHYWRRSRVVPQPLRSLIEIPMVWELATLLHQLVPACLDWEHFSWTIQPSLVCIALDVVFLLLENVREHG